MHVRERARLGAVALGAGAAVLALIQILEQSVSAFSPRPVVSALITVVVALVGATLARGRSVSQRRQFLSNVLRQSPMPTAADADPYMLGVFRPHTASGDGIGPYVPRSVDDQLERALAKGGFVLLIGVPKAGKSRSAYEAVLRRLSGQKLLVPYGGEALPSIIGDASLRSEEAVWWLDDLGRFLPGLDGPSLDELLNGGHVVVASVRADTWEALLKADGDAGEQARNLLAGAFTLHMTAEHTPEELADAARLYPDLDVSNGIGPALTADVPESREPVTRPPEHAETPHRFDPLLALLLLGTVAASVFLAGLIVGGGFSDSTPPPVASQVEQILGDGFRSGKQLVYYNLDADLHGLNQQSWVFVWRARSGSDQIQIYDEENGRLARRLEFPTGSGSKDPGRIVGQQLLNLDGFFEKELVAAYTSPKIWPAQVPIVITWNEARGRYVLAPLLPRSISSKTVPIDLAPSLQKPVRIVYHSGSTYAVKAYPVDKYKLVPSKGSKPALLVVATRTGTKIRDLGFTVPAVAVTTFSMRPLISTDDVPQLACVYPLTNITKDLTILKAESPLTSLSGETPDPFVPSGGSGPLGFADSGTNEGQSGEELLSDRARHTRAQPTPCGTGFMTTTDSTGTAVTITRLNSSATARG
jgi:hypothetical protein